MVHLSHLFIGHENQQTVVLEFTDVHFVLDIVLVDQSPDNVQLTVT